MKSTHPSNHQVIFFPQEVQTLFPGQRCNPRQAVSDRRSAYPIRAGDVILCNDGVVHDESHETYQTICLGIKGLQLPDLPPNHIIAHNKTPIFHRPAQFDDLSALLQIILRQADQQAPLYLHICQQLMLSVLKLTEQMILEYGTENNIQQNELCAQVEAYIYTHYQQDLAIEQLGKLFFVSPYHLAHVFKQHTGYTLKQYILRRRIGEAQDRLSYSSDSITQIAREVGFEASAYFSRIFTKYVGMSPKFYREYRTKSDE